MVPEKSREGARVYAPMALATKTRKGGRMKTWKYRKRFLDMRYRRPVTEREKNVLRAEVMQDLKMDFRESLKHGAELCAALKPLIEQIGRIEEALGLQPPPPEKPKASRPNHLKAVS
jgi:hypothetical protein